MENEILRVLVLAILVAAAISSLPKATRERVVAGFETASQIIFSHLRDLRLPHPRAGGEDLRLQHLPLHPNAQGRAA